MPIISEYHISESGSLHKLTADGINYPFHITDPWQMHWQWNGKVITTPVVRKGNTFQIVFDNWRLEWRFDLCDQIAIKMQVSLTNTSGEDQCCRQLQLISGIDSCMVSYPQWMDKLFPTNLRYETTHFHGLFASPSGHFLALIAPNVIDSFSWCYNEDGGHRIYTVTLDLIQMELPRPSRFLPPQGNFAAGESRTWEFYFVPLQDEDSYGEAVAFWANAPYAQWINSSGAEERLMEFELFVPAEAELEYTANIPNPEIISSSTRNGVRRELRRMNLQPRANCGFEHLYFSTGNRKCHVTAVNRQNWQWYVFAASEYARRFRPPLATHVCEAMMPIFSLMAAEQIAPSPSRKSYIEGFLNDDLFQVAFSPEGTPLIRPDRIQNSATALDASRQMFELTGEMRYFDRCVKLTEFLLSCQCEDGAFYTIGTHIHYTAVIYLAKSLLDFVPVARRIKPELGDRIYQCVYRAMEDLYNRGIDIETEGEMTYEDGMISCSALQLAQFSVISGDQKYADKARKLMQSHRCLEWRGGDCRIHGGSIRFWESYWADGWGNCINTPHGWSAWTGYAYYYLYLAQGRMDDWNKFCCNLTAILSLVDPVGGTFYFCFTPDPTIRPDGGQGQPTAGERYLTMTTPGNWPEGGSESHEVIRLLETAMIGKGYLFFHENRWHSVNCKLEGDCVIPDTGVKTIYLNQHQSDGKTFQFPEDITVVCHGC